MSAHTAAVVVDYRAGGNLAPGVLSISVVVVIFVVCAHNFDGYVRTSLLSRVVIVVHRIPYEMCTIYAACGGFVKTH